MSTFSDNIVMLRYKEKLSQEEISNLLSVSRPSISGYEAGRVEPTFRVLIKYSEIFNVSIDELIKGRC